MNDNEWWQGRRKDQSVQTKKRCKHLCLSAQIKIRSKRLGLSIQMKIRPKCSSLSTPDSNGHTDRPKCPPDD